MEKQENLVLNLGTGKGHSVQNIISYIEEKGQTKIPIVKGKRFLGDPPILIANGDQAMKTLHWRPSLGLSTIIETAWNWHRQRFEVGV